MSRAEQREGGGEDKLLNSRATGKKKFYLMLRALYGRGASLLFLRGPFLQNDFFMQRAQSQPCQGADHIKNLKVHKTEICDRLFAWKLFFAKSKLKT